MQDAVTVELTETEVQEETEPIAVATMCPAGLRLGVETDCRKDCESCEGNLHDLCVEEAFAFTKSLHPSGLPHNTLTSRSCHD